MKTSTVILWLVVVLLEILIVEKVSRYDERMTQYNRYMCAVYGYYEDCKTPLRPEDRLK